jgi:hypothetical protein
MQERLPFKGRVFIILLVKWNGKGQQDSCKWGSGKVEEKKAELPVPQGLEIFTIRFYAKMECDNIYKHASTTTHFQQFNRFI